MKLSDKELLQIEEATNWAKKSANRNQVARRYTAPGVYPPEEFPFAIFMAGSPGAGKTETSKALIQNLDPENKVIRIDADELREHVPGYDGKNSYLYHKAVSILVERIIDNTFKNQQSFVLDGTLSSFGPARKNIARALKHERAVFVFYVYMDPLQAWDFVQRRETVEGRRIEQSVFIEQFFQARNVVNQLKAEFGGAITVQLLHKDVQKNKEYFKANIEQIDSYIAQKYNPQSLEIALKANA